jgi:hypothetical protein
MIARGRVLGGWLALAFFLAAACSKDCPDDQSGNPRDCPGDQDGSPPCPVDQYDNPPFSCHLGGPGQCDDVGRKPLCQSGSWKCGTDPNSHAPLTPSTSCTCYGPTPPGCTCGTTGFVCQGQSGIDAGSPRD